MAKTLQQLFDELREDHEKLNQATGIIETLINNIRTDINNGSLNNDEAIQLVPLCGQLFTKATANEDIKTSINKINAIKAKQPSCISWETIGAILMISFVVGCLATPPIGWAILGGIATALGSTAGNMSGVSISLTQNDTAPDLIGAQSTLKNN